MANFQHIAVIAFTTGSTTATLTSTEDITSFLPGDVIFPAGQLPVKIASIADRVVTLSNAALFTTGSTTAIMMAGDVSLRDALNQIQLNNATWLRHFAPFLKWVSSVNEKENLIDANGTAILSYTPFHLNSIIDAIELGGFINLVDTPANFTDAAGKILQVNAGATAIEFVEPGASQYAMSKVVFDSTVCKRRQTNIGSGDMHLNMGFADYYTTPATTPYQFTLNARNRFVNGIKYVISAKNITIPAASSVVTTLSNQTLVMFETRLINITSSNAFYLKSDGDSTVIAWSTSTANHTTYLQDFENNIFIDNGILYQYVYNHVVTALTQNYAKNDNAAIIAAGYTQGTVGDNYIHWTKTGIEAVALCMVQQGNQGAHHQVVNPNGTARFGDGNFWYNTNNANTTAADCFTTQLSGDIASTVSGHPSGDLFYDAVTASDIWDLRISSRIVDSKTIRETFKRKAIAGTVRGFEGVPFLRFFDVNTASGVFDTPTIGVADSTLYNVGDLVIVQQDGAREYATRHVAAIPSATNITLDVNVWRTPNGVIAVHSVQLHAQANPTWTDIVGVPAQIAATFPNGVEGQWIPVLPDSSEKVYKLNRKSLESSINRTNTQNNGVSWGNNSAVGVDNTLNKIISGSSSIPANEVAIFNYETQAHFTEDDVNSEVIDLGGVFATNRYTVDAGQYSGALLINSLLGKVLTNTNTSALVAVEMPIGAHSFKHDTHSFQGNVSFAQQPKHEVINLVSGANPAGKTLDYLTESNGVGKLCYAFKEMFYDVGTLTNISTTAATSYVTGTGYRWSAAGFGRLRHFRIIPLANITLSSATIAEYYYELDGYIMDAGTKRFKVITNTVKGWGDNNKFEISDNQTTVIDINGNSVLYGTASFRVPFYIVNLSDRL